MEAIFSFFKFNKMGCLRLNITIFVLILLSFINSQLTRSDISYIKKVITNLRDTKTGLFSESDDMLNLIAVESLQLINEDVNKKPFCRELDLSKEEPNYPRVVLNELLQCEIKFLVKKQIQENPFAMLSEIQDISELSLAITLLRKLNINLDAETLYQKIKLYRTKLMLYSAKEESGVPSILASTEAIKLISSLYTEATKSELKEELKSEIKVIIQEMEGFLQVLGEDISAFTEINVDSLILNSKVLEAFSQISNSEIVDEEYLESINYKLLNFFLKFKHNATSLEKIHALLSSFKSLYTWPIFQIQRQTVFIDEGEDKSLPFKILDLVGREDSTYDVEVKYKRERQDKSKSVSQSADSSDLPDDEEIVLDEENENERVVKISNASEGKLVFDDLNQIGQYTYSLVITCRKTSGEGKVRIFKKKINFRGISRVKISYVSVAVSNTVEKADGKDSKVDFPKRSFRNIKATQNSVIKLKVKVSFFILFKIILCR